VSLIFLDFSTVKSEMDDRRGSTANLLWITAPSDAYVSAAVALVSSSLKARTSLKYRAIAATITADGDSKADEALLQYLTNVAQDCIVVWGSTGEFH